MRLRGLGLIVLVGCAAEPKSAPPQAAVVAAPAVVATPVAAASTVTGSWFALTVPAGWEERPLRIDVVTVQVPRRGAAVVRHLEDAVRR